MKTFTATAAKQNLGEIIDLVMAGETVAIERHGRAVMHCTPAQPQREARATQVAPPSKAQRLGLSRAYAWSNPEIEDDALILAVLQMCDPMDTARVIARYGARRVAGVARSESLDDYSKRSFVRVLPPILEGLRHAAS